MENKEKLHLSAIVNNWVQVLGIFLAGGCGKCQQICRGF